MSDTPLRYWLIVGYVVDGLGMDREDHHCYGPCSEDAARQQFIATMQDGYDDIQVNVTHSFSSTSPIE